MGILELSIAQIGEYLRTSDLVGPLAVTLTMLNIAGKPLHSMGNDFFEDQTSAFTEYGLQIDEIILPDVEAFADYSQWLPQVAHELFQTFGADECPYFLPDGKLNPAFMALLR